MPARASGRALTGRGRITTTTSAIGVPGLGWAGRRLFLGAAVPGWLASSSSGRNVVVRLRGCHSRAADGFGDGLPLEISEAGRAGWTGLGSPRAGATQQRGIGRKCSIGKGPGSKSQPASQRPAKTREQCSCLVAAEKKKTRGKKTKTGALRTLSGTVGFSYRHHHCMYHMHIHVRSILPRSDKSGARRTARSRKKGRGQGKTGPQARGRQALCRCIHTYSTQLHTHTHTHTHTHSTHLHYSNIQTAASHPGPASKCRRCFAGDATAHPSLPPASTPPAGLAVCRRARLLLLPARRLNRAVATDLRGGQQPTMPPTSQTDAAAGQDGRPGCQDASQDARVPG